MGLFDIFSTKPAEDAAKAKIAGINTGLTSANNYYGAGLSNANNYFGQALSPWSSLSGRANQGLDQYSTLLGNALGANGASGNAAATAAFQSNPGYQFALNQGIDQIDRRAASRGMLSSGNNNIDTINYSQGLANQGWQQYINNLQSSMSPFATLAGTSAQGQSGVLQNQAGLNYAGNAAQGQLNYQGQAGIGDANASADLAKYNASANGLGAIFGGLSSAASLAGGGGFGGNGFSFGPTSVGGAPVSGGLFSIFGGGK